MTAVAILKTEKSIFVLTDSKLSVDGLPHVSLGNTSKIFPMPHLNACLVTRGPARLLHLVALMLGESKSFDDLREKCGRLRDITAAHTENWQIETLTADWDLFVCGFGRDGATAFSVSNHNGHGATPWAVVPIEYFACSPTVDQADLDAFAASDNPAAALVDIHAAQRRADPVVGGFVQETVILPMAIGTHIIPVLMPG